MRRAIHLGLFLGTLIGMSACAAHPAPDAVARTGAYGSVEVGRGG